MKIVCVSDTHNLHHKVEMPDGDVLIHAGDATTRGRPHEVENFLRWMESLPYKTKIFVAGNHDYLFDKKMTHSYEESNRLLNTVAPNVVYLKDKEYKLPNGMLVYGSPWVNGLPDWAFGWKSPDGLESEWASIPNEVDILVTHSPAFGVLDALYSYRLGCERLAARLKELKQLKLHVHGHIHYSYGITHPEITPITVNAAICSEQYSPVNKPIVVEL